MPMHPSPSSDTTRPSLPRFRRFTNISSNLAFANAYTTFLIPPCCVSYTTARRIGSAGELVGVFDQGGMERPVARDHLFALQLERVAFVVGDGTSRLLQDEASGGDIPGVDAALVVGIESPGSDVAKVQGRRSQPPHALGARREAPEKVHRGGHLVALVRKARDHERPHELVLVRHAYTL